MPRASKRYIDIERTSVRGESFPTFVCKRCNAKPTRTDKINEDVLAVLLRSALGMKLPYLYTFQKFGHHEFGFVACTCPISGGRPLDAMFTCGFENGEGSWDGHTDYVLLNRFSRLTSFASMMVSLEHEAAHGAGLAHDEEMMTVEKRAAGRIAEEIPSLPPANVMANTSDAFHPGCPRCGERKVLAEIYESQPAPG